MSERYYKFETKNMGTAEIWVCGEYRDEYAKDFDAIVGDIEKNFEEIDDGEIIIGWMLDNGVEFESDKSMCFNAFYVTEVMAIREMTEEQALDEAAKWTDGYVKQKSESIRLS